MDKWLIKAKYIITLDEKDSIIEDGGLLIEEGTLKKIGSYDEVAKFSSKNHKIIDRSDSIIMPGFINAHTHIPMNLLRGICDDQTLEVWLNDYIWKYEPRMTAEDAKTGTLLGCLELIENGVVGFIDQYFYVDEVAQSTALSGLRALLCPGVFGPSAESDTIEEAFERAKEIIQKWKGKNKLLDFGLGPHAPYSVEKEMFVKVRQYAEEHNLPIHIHLSESKFEVTQAQEKWDMSPIERVYDVKLGGTPLLAAHCVHLNDNDRKLLKEMNATVLSNPQSNLKIASGIADIPKMLEAGINVALGTDGTASNNNLDVLEEIRLTALIHKGIHYDPKLVPATTALKMGTINGRKAMGLDANGLVEGAAADIIFFDLSATNNNPCISPVSNIVYSTSSRDITDVMVDGKWLYFNKEHKTLDKKAIIEKANSITKRILSQGLIE
ncbi:MAG: amidohydrolase family protein [Candidatus Kariarchaeaceae archaeon]